MLFIASVVGIVVLVTEILAIKVESCEISRFVSELISTEVTLSVLNVMNP